MVVAEPVSGYILNPAKGFFSVIVPTGKDRINLIPNPSFEHGTISYVSPTYTFTWAVGGATLSISTERVRRGAVSARVMPTATTSRLVSGDLGAVTGALAFSIDVWAPGGQTLIVAISTGTTLANAVAQQTFVATGGWQRLEVVCAQQTAYAGPLRGIVESPNSVVGRPWFADGAQMEVCPVGEEYATTYFDGDMKGALPAREDFYWLGKPQNSQSVRRGQCRIGGRRVPLKDLGLEVTAFQGLGLSPITNIVLPNAVAGGTLQSQQAGPRDFAIIGAMQGADLPLLEAQMGVLTDAFKPDLSSPAQPIAIRFEYYDDCGGAVYEPLELRAVYKSGLEGSVTNLNQERIAIQMSAFDPEAVSYTHLTLPTKRIV